MINARNFCNIVSTVYYIQRFDFANTTFIQYTVDISITDSHKCLFKGAVTIDLKHFENNDTHIRIGKHFLTVYF